MASIAQSGAIASALALHRLKMTGAVSFTYRVNNPGGPVEVSFEYNVRPIVTITCP